MVDVAEISKYIDFPIVNDITGRRLQPWDVVICSDYWGIIPYIVTDKLIGKNQALQMFELNNTDKNSNAQRKFEYKSKNKKLFIVNQEFSQDAIHKRVQEIKAIIDKQTDKTQKRFFVVFAKNKLDTNDVGIIFVNVESDPNKTINKNNLREASYEIIRKYPDYFLRYIDRNNTIERRLDTWNLRPRLFCYSNSEHYNNYDYEKDDDINIHFNFGQLSADYKEFEKNKVNTLLSVKQNFDTNIMESPANVKNILPSYYDMEMSSVITDQVIQYYCDKYEQSNSKQKDLYVPIINTCSNKVLDLYNEFLNTKYTW